MVDKYINKDGHVGVLVSKDYGAGWSTWNTEYDTEEMIFDKDIIKVIVDNPTRNLKSFRLRTEDKEKVKEIAKAKYPKAYLGGLSQCLEVDWLKPGTDFMIHEYDGSEQVWTEEDIKMYRA